LSTTIFELSNLNDCLFDLAPSLEAVPISIDDGDIEPDNADVISINALQDEESPYLGNVRDKFPKACASLAKDLAKLNWDRHVRIRDMRTRWENSQVQSELDTHRDQDTVGIQTSHAKDSGYQTMSLALSAALQSQSQIVKPRQTPSMMSFGATTNAEQVGRTRYPPPPVKLDPESGCFQCNICYRTLDGINSKLQWRYVLCDEDME
jgi:hypothetical protein